MKNILKKVIKRLAFVSKKTYICRLKEIEMAKRKEDGNRTFEDIGNIVDLIVENNSIDDMIAIVSGINEKLENDTFTTAMIAYFQTYIEPPDPAWRGTDE